MSNHDVAQAIDRHVTVTLNNCYNNSVNCQNTQSASNHNRTLTVIIIACFIFCCQVNLFIYKVVSDEDAENNGKSNGDAEVNIEESEEDIYGVTTVIDLHKHQVGG